jgi:hypothetical protein
LVVAFFSLDVHASTKAIKSSGGGDGATGNCSPAFLKSAAKLSILSLQSSSLDVLELVVDRGAVLVVEITEVQECEAAFQATVWLFTGVGAI